MHITREIEPVTTDQCPAIVCAVMGFTKDVIQIMGMQSAPHYGPHQVLVQVGIECWAFSAQGTSDVMRQIAELTAKVESAIARDPGLGGACVLGGVTQGEIGECREYLIGGA